MKYDGLEFKNHTQTTNRTHKSKTNYYYNYHPTKVRHYLTKQGFNVGRYSESRISGWGNFYGDIEVAKKHIGFKFGESKNPYWQEVDEFQGVAITIHRGDIDIVLESLKQGGFDSAEIVGKIIIIK